MRKKVAVIGAGFTGMTVALRLAQAGWEVEVFEKEDHVGGLADGFKDPKWKWPLEKHYHHLFSSDTSIQRLAAEVGHELIYSRPITSTFIDVNQTYQLDSIPSLLSFPALSIIDRLRTGIGLALLKLNPFWQVFENITAKDYIQKVMGSKSWQILWKPLFAGKFGPYADQIGAVWFWARIFTRTPSLGYPKGGFAALANSIKKHAQSKGVRFNLGRGVTRIVKSAPHFVLTDDNGNTSEWDKVICTLPTPFFFKITPGLPAKYVAKYQSLQGIGAVNLVLALKKKFMDNIYWLNINKKDMPFLAVVEHTNFASSNHYGGDKLVYVGNYLPAHHQYFQKNEPELLDIFSKHLAMINPDFKKSWVRKAWVWKAPFAQAIVTPGYSLTVPPFKTPIEGLYLCNIQQLHPWERGTNYSVKFGEKIARLCLHD